MELWDVYDIDRNIIQDRVVSRSNTNLKSGEFHLVTVGWILNSQNKLLMQKRAANKVYPLVYANHGGCAIKGESSKASMVRELHEELGIKFREDDLQLLRSFNDEESIFDEYITLFDINLDELVIDKSEVESCEWFTLNELSELIDNGNSFNYKTNNPNGVSSFELIKKYIKDRKIGC